MLIVAAAALSLSLTTSSGLVLDPETSMVDQPSVYRDIAYRVAQTDQDNGDLLGEHPLDQPGQPANLHMTPDIESAPNYDSGPAREAAEAKIKQDLKGWEEKVEQYRNDAKASGSEQMRHEAKLLTAKFLIVANQWQKLRQTKGEDWESERGRLDSAVGDLRTQWKDAQQATASAR